METWLNIEAALFLSTQTRFPQFMKMSNNGGKRTKIKNFQILLMVHNYYCKILFYETLSYIIWQGHTWNDIYRTHCLPFPGQNYVSKSHFSIHTPFHLWVRVWVCSLMKTFNLTLLRGQSCVVSAIWVSRGVGGILRQRKRRQRKGWEWDLRGQN